MFWTCWFCPSLFLSGNGLSLPLRKCFSPNPALCFWRELPVRTFIFSTLISLYPATQWQVHDWSLSDRSSPPLATGWFMSSHGYATQARTECFIVLFLTGVGGKMLSFLSGGKMRTAHRCLWPCFWSLLTSCLREWSLNEESRDERHRVFWWYLRLCIHWIIWLMTCPFLVCLHLCQ